VALPLHPEFRTLPSLFYVPPLLPAMAEINDDKLYHTASSSLWEDMENSRLPLKYLASLFSAGDTTIIRNILKKLMGVRLHRRAVSVGDMDQEEVNRALLESGLSTDMADEIYRLTALAKIGDRFVIPPAHREEAIEMMEETHERKSNAGFGFTKKPKRGL
jgi:nitrate reductase beta subunit